MELKEMANLSLEVLVKECRLKNAIPEDIFLAFRYRNRENIHDIFRYKKFNYDFTDYITVYNDGKHIVGSLKPCYEEFLRSICIFLNIPINNKIIDDESLTKCWKERIERLKEIRSSKELMKEFPMLYQDLIQGRKFIESLRGQKNLSKEMYEKQRHYYYACALKERVDNFIKTQTELYTRFTERRKEYQQKVKKTNYNDLIKKYFDINKVAMYTIHTYLQICEETESIETIKEYLPLFDKYQQSTYDKSVVIQPDEGEKIDIDKINKRIDNIKRKANNREGQVEWVIIPEGREYKKVKKGSSEPRIDIFNYEEIERLKKKGQRKNRFYEGTNYLVKVAGLRKYRGYVGYVYSNGEVLIDREYDDEHPKSDKGNAIYNIKVADFETLSKYDKTSLRNNPKVGRIIHSKNWEKKARKIIEKEETEKTKEEAKQLVYRLKK